MTATMINSGGGRESPSEPPDSPQAATLDGKPGNVEQHSGTPVRRILAIDPGPVHTGWAIIDTQTRRSIAHGKDPNDVVLDALRNPQWVATLDHVVIEMIASYGMAVGAEVFETCIWIGRYSEALDRHNKHPEYIKRLPIKIHHCHTAKATDTNIRQALVDRFAPGQPNHGKGTNKQPGWFHGFKTDVWAAYALAVYAADTHTQRTPQ